ncbi:hypothetical protein DL96DRAFT_1822487 [Flagelloscypha sp. PMI_526]|nr:hypothetical protein DL96DRAFT_1822487 [Flagelloscypha sp. PMI_526]
MSHAHRTGRQDRRALTQLILDNEPQHSHLINSLDDLQPALVSLEIKQRELCEMQKELEDCKETLKMLTTVTQKDQRSLESVASGAVAVKVKHMFARSSNMLKQEETMNRVLHFRNVEAREREREERLTRRITTLKDEIAAITFQSDKIQAIRRELELLYNHIFDTARSGSHQEEQAESEVQAVQVLQTKACADLSIEDSVIDLLRAALKVMNLCQDQLREAVCCSAALVLSSNIETNRLRSRHLAEAHTLASDCRATLIEARELCPSIKAFDSFTFADRPLIRTRGETAFKGLIDQTVIDMDCISLQITVELSSAGTRVRAAMDVVEQTSKELMRRQAALFTIRRKIVERVLKDMEEVPASSTSALSTLPGTSFNPSPGPSSWPSSSTNPDPANQDDPPRYSKAEAPRPITDGPFVPLPLKPRYRHVPPLAKGHEKSASYSPGDSAVALPAPRQLSPSPTESPPSLPALIPQSPLPTFGGVSFAKNPRKRWGFVEGDRRYSQL